MLVVDMHLRDRYIIVVDGLVRRRGSIGIVVDHLAGMYLRQSHRFILMGLIRFSPDLLLEPHFQVVLQRHCSSPFPVQTAAPTLQDNIR